MPPLLLGPDDDAALVVVAIVVTVARNCRILAVGVFVEDKVVGRSNLRAGKMSQRLGHFSLPLR